MSFFSNIASAVSTVAGVTGIALSETGQVIVSGVAPQSIAPENIGRRTRAAKPAKGKPAAKPVNTPARRPGRPRKAAATAAAPQEPAPALAQGSLTERILGMLPTDGALSREQILGVLANSGSAALPNHVGIALKRLQRRGQAAENAEGGWSRTLAAETLEQAAA